MLRLLLPAILLAGACATTPPPPPKGGPRGIRASEHLDAARDHDEAARNAHRWPALGSTAAGENVAMPWVRTWDTGEHGRLAAIHRSKASELHAEYAEACGTRGDGEVARSPLERYGMGGWNTTTGVIVYLSKEAGDAERLLKELACHRAWMMLAPAGMDDCPLDLPGLVIDARGDGDGVTLSLAVRDAKLVPELQRRTAHDLEAARVRARGGAAQ